MFAKSTLTVDDKDLTVGLSVKRTLSATKVQLTDYSLVRFPMPGSSYPESVRCSDSVTINGPNQALSSLR